MSTLIAYTDGGARGNPGPAGIGVVLLNEHRDVLEEHAVYLGEATNNQAEYQAAILALERAIALGADELHLVADSELLVRQAMGMYRVRNQDLAKLYAELKALERQIGKVTYRHVPRSQNKRADALSNKAMDEGVAGLAPGH